MERFGAITRGWFEAAFEGPTEVQRHGWQTIASGEHALLIAPTGSGKTLAAFLWCIDRLTREGPGQSTSNTRSAGGDPGAGVKVLYISPLKALVYDVERNLRAPLTGIGRRADNVAHPVYLPRVSVRTGDTSAKERRDQAKNPGDILVTTPESLYLLLGSRRARTCARSRP